MLVLRLARTGRKKYATYRLVAADSRRAATGKFVTVLGHYNPHTKDLVIKKAETEQFLANGAQPSNIVIKLLQSQKIALPKWAEFKTKQKAAKKTEAAPKSEASAAETAVVKPEASETTPAALPAEPKPKDQEASATKNADKSAAAKGEAKKPAKPTATPAADNAIAIEEQAQPDTIVPTADSRDAEAEAAEKGEQAAAKSAEAAADEAK